MSIETWAIPVVIIGLAVGVFFGVMVNHAWHMRRPVHAGMLFIIAFLTGLAMTAIAWGIGAAVDPHNPHEHGQRLWYPLLVVGVVVQWVAFALGDLRRRNPRVHSLPTFFMELLWPGYRRGNSPI